MGDMVLNKNELNVNLNATTITKSERVGFLHKLFKKKHRIEKLESKVNFICDQLNTFYQNNSGTLDAKSLSDLNSKFDQLNLNTSAHKC